MNASRTVEVFEAKIQACSEKLAQAGVLQDEQEQTWWANAVRGAITARVHATATLPASVIPEIIDSLAAACKKPEMIADYARQRGGTVPFETVLVLSVVVAFSNMLDRRLKRIDAHAN